MEYLIKGTGKILEEDLGREKAKEIVVKANRRLEELKRENASDPEALRSHTYKRIYPGIAMWETLRAEGIESEKAVWYVREYYQRMCKMPAKMIQALAKLPGVAGRIPGLFLNMSTKSFSAEAGFGYEWPDLPEDTVGFDIVHCPYFETCTRYGCASLTVAFCDSDDATYGHMHPSLLWGRTSTLGHGAPCCDFRLTRVEEKGRK